MNVGLHVPVDLPTCSVRPLRNKTCNRYNIKNNNTHANVWFCFHFKQNTIGIINHKFEQHCSVIY